MTTTTYILNGRDTVVVPVVSLEEMPQLTTGERKHLIAELEDTEAAMKFVAFESYSPEWLRQRFLNVFARSDK